jgi:hypothetical protein
MDVLTFYIDDTAPAIVRRLSLQEGGDFDVVGSQQFRLLVRPLWSEHLHDPRRSHDARRRPPTS